MCAPDLILCKGMDGSPFPQRKEGDQHLDRICAHWGHAACSLTLDCWWSGFTALDEGVSQMETECQRSGMGGAQ
jgi:hypothetical protein